MELNEKNESVPEVGGESFSTVDISSTDSEMDKEDKLTASKVPNQVKSTQNVKPTVETKQNDDNKQHAAEDKEDKNETKQEKQTDSKNSENITQQETETNASNDAVATKNSDDDNQEIVVENPQQKFEEEEEEYISPRKSRSKSSRSKESSIAEKFSQFIQNREEVSISIDESKVEFAPPALRTTLNTLIKNVKRWAARNPTGASLEALQILAERLDEFLELQTRRDDPEYDEKARELLNMIYKNTSQAQRLARNLKDAAVPRPVDEY